MIKNIRNYLWFVKESQSFMKGHNPVAIFFQSIFLGIGFCKEMNKWDDIEKRFGKEAAYCMLNRNIEF